MAEKKDDNKPKKKPLDIAFLGMVLFAVVNVAVVGVGAYYVYAATIGWHAPQITEKKLSAEAENEEQVVGPLVYTMDKFTVNLSGDPLKDPKRTIQLEINLEMLNREGFEEVINGDNRAKARDKIIQIIGSKKFDQIETIQGKLFLKDQIATEVNGLLDKGIVKDVYFTQFVVQ